MKITKDNYEAFFIDYLDGNLEESLVNEFIEFLQNNPALKEELQIAGSVVLEPEKIPFKEKKKLYKEKYDLQNEFDRAAIALLEGDLSEEEHASFKKYLSSHPDQQREISLFEKTKLKADEAIKFPGRNRLYRQTAGKTLFLWTTRAAAVFLLALLTYFFADNIRKEQTIPGYPATVTESRDTKEKTEPVTPPEKRDNQDEQVPAKEKIAPPVNNTKSHSQPVKSPRESAVQQKQREYIAETRIPAEVPDRINSRQASFTLEQQVIALAEVKQPPAIQTVNDYEERLLGDIVKEKTGLADLSVNKLVKAGLGLVSIVSKDKFTFETNSAGEITEFSYDSRLLAISIPTKND